MYHNQIFIDKHDFNEESKLSKHQGKWTEKLGLYLIQLTRNIIHSSRFNIRDIQNEVYYELEMYILEKLLIRYLKKYDEDRGNGFTLATSMVINLSYDFLRKLKNHDATGRPKYHKKRNTFTKEKDRVVYVYLDNSATIDKIY